MTIKRYNSFSLLFISALFFISFPICVAHPGAAFAQADSFTVIDTTASSQPGGKAEGDRDKLALRPVESSQPVVNNDPVISGICTAGTVRVNNLANVEAFLNVLANGTQIGCYLLSLIWLMRIKKVEPNRRLRKVCLIVGVMAVGYITPGAITFLVGTARDLNLFS